MKWKLHDDLMGAPERTRREWKGRSDADRKAAQQDINDRAPWKGGSEISKGHYDSLADSMRKLFGNVINVGEIRGNQRQRRGRIDTRQLDGAIDALNNMPDEPMGEDPRTLTQRFYDTYSHSSDREYKRQAALWFHPDKFPAAYKRQAHDCFVEVMRMRQK